MRKFFGMLIIVTALLAVVAGGVAPALAQGGDDQDPEPGDPSVWTERVCSGEAAIVWQSKSEEGDGVTLSTLDSEGCDADETKGWLVVEPWFGAKLNPDRACLAFSWKDVQDFAELSELFNGSAWRVKIAELEGHALVLPCLSADGKEWQLGLNPFESQLDVRRLRGTLKLLDELLTEAGTDREQYLAESSDPLAAQINAALADD